MAKSFLADYRIGDRIAGDLIDRIEPLIDDGLGFEPNSGDTSPESPPVGSEPEKAAGDDSAAVSPDADEAPKVTVSKDGLFWFFTIAGMSYRLSGVKTLFVTSLRVNIRAQYNGKSYPDSLDLYSARARSSFAQAVSRQWPVDPSRIERDLVTILEKLETERDEKLETGSKKSAVAMSAVEREEGMALLKDPDLFTRIADDLSALGYVGEDLNKQLLYLCASSRKLDDPISVLILSQSASGKSFLVDCVKRLMPAEEVVAVTSLSDQALNYIEDLSHKFLVLGEAVHGEVVEHQIREMLSGKELSRLVTIKDPETGQMQSRIVRTPVIVASVMSGTSHAVNPENASRCFVAHADESRDQTARIHEYQRSKYSLERYRGKGDVENIVRAHRAAQRLLTKRVIVNDFAPLLDFPTTLMRLRRDHDRFLDLIACVCFVRQYQKEEEHASDFRFIRCDLADYRIAYRIMVEGVLGATIRELPEGCRVLYDELRKLARGEAEKQEIGVTEVSLTQRLIREATSLGHTWVKLHLRLLIDYEYVSVQRGGGERSKGFYRLREDADLPGADLSMIPTPEAMARKLAEAKGGKR